MSKYKVIDVLTIILCNMKHKDVNFFNLSL